MPEKLVQLIEKLAETYILVFLVLFLPGALLLATAATGGWPQFNITVSEPLWRYLTGFCGVMLMLVAIAFLFLERRTTKLPKAKVSIDYPNDGIHVRVPCPVTGKCNRLPPKTQLWLFNLGSQSTFWPQQEIRVLPDRSWRTELNATNFKDGEKRKFAIFLIGESGQALIHHFKSAGIAINAIEPKNSNRHWPAITMLTSDMVRSTDIREVTISRG